MKSFGFPWRLQEFFSAATPRKGALRRLSAALYLLERFESFSGSHLEIAPLWSQFHSYYLMRAPWIYRRPSSIPYSLGTAPELPAAVLRCIVYYWKVQLNSNWLTTLSPRCWVIGCTFGGIRRTSHFLALLGSPIITHPWILIIRQLPKVPNTPQRSEATPKGLLK